MLSPDDGKAAPAARATTISFQATDGKQLGALLVGKKYFKNETSADSPHAQADGRFVMLPEDQQHAFIVSDPLTQASAASADWISRDGFAIERIKSIEVKPAAYIPYAAVDSEPE